MEIIVYLISLVICAGLLYWGWSFEKDELTLGDLSKMAVIVFMPIGNTIAAAIAVLGIVIYCAARPTFWNKVIIKGKRT